jgi:hypothetical protein
MSNLDSSGKNIEKPQINQALIEVEEHETKKKDSVRRISRNYNQLKKIEENEGKQGLESIDKEKGIEDYIRQGKKVFKEKIWDNVSDDNKICCVCSSICCCFIFVMLFYSFLIKG